MSDLRTIGSLGNQNKKNLREYFGIKNIRSAYSIFGVSTQQEAYEAMREVYNLYVEQQKEIKRQTELQRRQLESQENKRIRNIKKNMKNFLGEFEEFTTKRNKNLFLNEIRDTVIKKNRRNLFKEIRENKVRKIMKDVLEEIKLKNKLIFTTKHYADEVTYTFENRSDIQSTELYNQVKTSIVNILMNNIGKKMYAISSASGEKFYEISFEVPNETRTKMFRFFDYRLERLITYYSIETGEQINIFENTKDGREQGEYGKISIFIADEPLPVKLQQSYLDGEEHCVIKPLLNIFQGYADNATTKESKRKLNKTVEKLKEFEKTYINGVPEEDMGIIGRAISRCIVIHDLFGGEVIKYNPKSTSKIHFTNTRKNHLDIGHITLGGKPIKIKKDEMIRIIKEHDEGKIFYIFDGNITEGKMFSLSSSEGNWVVVNDEYEIYSKFDNEIGKRGFGINSFEYPQLNKFLKEGQIINASPIAFNDEPNNLENVKHIDVTKAYTQFKCCKHYRGFLGNIHQYSRLNLIDEVEILNFLKKHIGIYQVKIIKCENKLLNKVGIFENNIYTLPDPEILTFIHEYGIKIELIAGAYGSKFDFDFPKYMLENRRYCIWSGKLGQDSEYRSFNFEGDDKWASHLKYQFMATDNKVFHYKSTNLISVELKKFCNYTYHHILAFITSYTRLNVLNEMSKIDGELVKVILDGIYYRGNSIIDKVDVPCKESSELKRHVGFTDAWYHQSSIDTSNWGTHDNMFDTNVILCGQGGSGKTYHVFNSKTLLKPLYVVPTHVLGRHFAKEYGCQYITIHKLAGIDCQSFASEKGYSPPSVLIDEITMMSKEMIFDAMKANPTTRFILAGDVDEEKWYQCRSGKGKEYNEIISKKLIKEELKSHREIVDKYYDLFKGEDWNLKNDLTSLVGLDEMYKWNQYRISRMLTMNDTFKFRYAYFHVDRRSKDDELKKMKLFVRNCMDQVFTDGGMDDAYEITQMVKRKYKTISFNNAMKQFKEGDIFIAGTHKTNDLLLENNIVSGYLSKDKELIFDTNDVRPMSVKRGSFTTHSFQGFTIKDKKVFIVLDLFEYAMLYTSISRCVNFNQIVLVNRPWFDKETQIEDDEVETPKIDVPTKTEKELKKEKRQEKKIQKEITTKYDIEKEKEKCKEQKLIRIEKQIHQEKQRQIYKKNRIQQIKEQERLDEIEKMKEKEECTKNEKNRRQHELIRNMKFNVCCELMKQFKNKLMN